MSEKKTFKMMSGFRSKEVNKDISFVSDETDIMLSYSDMLGLDIVRFDKDLKTPLNISIGDYLTKKYGEEVEKAISRLISPRCEYVDTEYKESGVDGLGIHKFGNCNWALSHLASGMSMIQGFRLKKFAKACVDELGTLEIDYTVGIDELSKDKKKFIAMSEICRKHKRESLI